MNSQDWGDALAALPSFIPIGGALIFFTVVLVRIVKALLGRNRTDELRGIARPFTHAMAVQSSLLGVPPQTQQDMKPVDPPTGLDGITCEDTARNQP